MISLTPNLWINILGVIKILGDDKVLFTGVVQGVHLNLIFWIWSWSGHCLNIHAKLNHFNVRIWWPVCLQIHQQPHGCPTVTAICPMFFLAISLVNIVKSTTLIVRILSDNIWNYRLTLYRTHGIIKVVLITTVWVSLKRLHSNNHAQRQCFVCICSCWFYPYSPGSLTSVALYKAIIRLSQCQ